MKNYNLVFNKIHQTIDKFTLINSPLEKILGMKFGYAALFKDGSYYNINSNIECIERIVHNIERSSILCERNISNKIDNFSYLLWPDKRHNQTVEIFSEYGFEHSISLVKENEEYFDVYYFSGIDETKNWQDFFMRHKEILRDYVKYFKKYKKDLRIDADNIKECLFKFSKGVDLVYPESTYSKEDQQIDEFKKLLFSSENQHFFSNKDNQFAPREMQVISLVVKGYTAKMVALELNLAIKTIQHYIENIKRKLSINNKYQLIKYYETRMQKI